MEIETLCQRACSCPQLRGGPEQRDFTASCLHGAISPTCAFPPISHLQSRKWELGSIDENERNVFETPQKGPVFVPTIRHHQNEPTDPPIWCWHQHQTKMLVCHLCFREGGQFAWPKTGPKRSAISWCLRCGVKGEHPTMDCTAASPPIILPDASDADDLQDVCLWCSIKGHCHQSPMRRAPIQAKENATAIAGLTDRVDALQNPSQTAMPCQEKCPHWRDRCPV